MKALPGYRARAGDTVHLEQGGTATLLGWHDGKALYRHNQGHLLVEVDGVDAQPGPAHKSVLVQACEGSQDSQNGVDWLAPPAARAAQSSGSP